MFRLFLSVIAPLVSLFILILGNGLFNTLLAVRLEMDGMSSWVIGGVSAAYYGGLVLGSWLCEPFITRVGHIRAFSTFASLTAVVSLLPGMFVDAYFWIALRVIGGFSIAGLFVVIESWLLASSTMETRGKVLSIYMTALYAAQGAGQFLLNLSDPQTIMPFCIVAILSSISILPVCMTYRSSPYIEESSSLSFFKLYKISPTGVIGCFCGGLILGAIYGLMPLFTSSIDFTLEQIAMTMGLTIFGGMFLQYPVGHISDHFDRRKVLMVLSFLTTIISLALIPSAFISTHLFMSLVFVFGGFAFVLYPLSVSHGCDYLDSGDIVAATGGLLLAYGIGATLGPLIAPIFISLIGPVGLLVYYALVAGTLGIFILWRSTRREPIPTEEQQSFVAVPHTTPIAGEMDPRSEVEE